MKRELYLEPNLKTKKSGTLWCVYCGDWKVFTILPTSKSNYDRCEGCTISTEDYYIKDINKLWGMPEAREKAKKNITKSKKGK